VHKIQLLISGAESESVGIASISISRSMSSISFVSSIAVIIPFTSSLERPAGEYRHI